MRLLAAMLLMLSLSFAQSGIAHEPEPGQTFFIYTFSDLRIETDDLSVTMEILNNDVLPKYSITLRLRETGLEATHQFEQAGGPEPSMVAYNGAYYCDQRVFFVTLRYPIPPMADIRQYDFETHAFLAQTLEYLDTANVPFENIAPHEVGADFGWPYITPQRYLVVCSDDGEAPGIRFRLNPEAEY